MRIVFFILFAYIGYHFSIAAFQELTKLENRIAKQAIVIEKQIHVNKHKNFCPSLVAQVVYKSMEYKTEIFFGPSSCDSSKWVAIQKMNTYEIGQAIDVLISNEDRMDVVLSDYSVWNPNSLFPMAIVIISLWGLWVVAMTDYEKWYRDRNIWQD